MTDEGKSAIGFGVVAKLFLVLLFTIIPSTLVIWILTLASLVDSTFRGQGFLLATGCFLLGSTLVIFSGFSREKILFWASGFIIAAGFLVLNGINLIILMIIMYPTEVIGVSVVSALLIIFVFLRYFPTEQPHAVVPVGSEVLSLSRLKISPAQIIGGVELREITEEYLERSLDDSSISRIYRPFLDILRGMTLANIPLALRIERIEEKTRIFYLTWAKDENTLSEQITRLESSLIASLPGMKFGVFSRFDGVSLPIQQVAATSSLRGEPLSIIDDDQRKDALTADARILQTFENGIIQISSSPRQSNSRQLKRLEEKYRDQIQRAEYVISSPKVGLFMKDTQESTTHVNSDAQRNAISIKKQIERLSKKHLCEVQVTALCWSSEREKAEKLSNGLMVALAGNLTPADDMHDFSVKTSSKPIEISKLLSGTPVGDKTLLSVDEAAVYFILPRCDLGIPVVDHASFHSNPAQLHPTQKQTQQDQVNTRPAIEIGKVFDDTGRVLNDYRIPIEDLASHTGIYGDTGSGKTMTQISILRELHTNGIHFLVLLASKNEDYARLLSTMKELRIFTIGDETVAPLRFCLTNFHDGVHVSSIINCIKDAFVATKPTEGIIKEYLETLIELTFMRLGWDRDTNTRGLPIVLQDFVETIPLAEKKLRYSIRGNEDVRGALYGRFDSCNNGSLNSIFGTTSGISVDEIAECDTILLTDKISKDERALLMYWLINNLTLHFEAKKKAEPPSKNGLKYYVVLEEAHRFLTGGQGIKVDEGHGAQRAAIDTISVAMSESRSSGLGFGLATQKPSQLNNETCSMTMNIIMHNTRTLSERQLIGDQMNCNDEQITMMGALPVGQAIIRIASSSKPVRVQVNNPLDLLPQSACNSPFSEVDIASQMRPIIKQNPHFEERHHLKKRKFEQEDFGVLLPSIQLNMKSIVKLYAVINFLSSKGYQSGIRKATETGNVTRFATVFAIIIRNLAEKIVPDDSSLLFYCLHLAWRFSKTEDIWTPEVLDEVLTALSQLLSVEKNVLREDVSDLHERVYQVGSQRVKDYSTNDEALERLIESAVKDAVAEYSAMPVEIEKPREPDVPLDDDLPQTIEYVVKVKTFVEQYLTRMKKAAAGDLGPVIRLIETVARKFVTSSFSLADVSMMLLHSARAAHRIPKDDSLWARICAEVYPTGADEGTESAT